LAAITSKDNRYLKLFRRLYADAAARRAEGLFAIEGARLCGDAAASGVGIRAALITPAAEVAYPDAARAVREVAAESWE